MGYYSKRAGALVGMLNPTRSGGDFIQEWECNCGLPSRYQRVRHSSKRRGALIEMLNRAGDLCRTIPLVSLYKRLCHSRERVGALVGMLNRTSNLNRAFPLACL